MRNKIFTNINMPPQNQNQQIRNQALQYLENAKSKLNKLTYLALKRRIKDKRIDAVKRISEKIRQVKYSTNNNIRMFDIKTTIQQTKEQKLSKLQSQIRRKQITGIANVKQFNKSGNDTTITGLNPNKLKRILRNLDLNQKVILNVGNTYYTIRKDNINEFINMIDELWVGEDDIVGSDGVLIQRIKDFDSITLTRPKWLGQDINEGAFFPYYNKTQIQLKDFQIYTGAVDYKDNCFVYALIQSEVLTKIEIARLKSMCIGLYIPTNKFSEICKKFELYIRVKHINHHTTKNYGNKNHKEVVLGLIDKHYFFVKPIEYTMYSIKNYKTINEYKDWNKIYKITEKETRRAEDRFTDSFQAIKYMFENKEDYFEEMPYEDILDTQYFNEAKEIKDLNYCEDVLKENEVKEMKDKSENAKIIFFDCEATTNEDIHKPYMICSSETDCITGEKCGLTFLRTLYEKFAVKIQYSKKWNKVEEKWDFTPINKQVKLILIAHNAKYDFSFLQQYITLKNLCQSGSRLLECSGMFFYGKKSIDIIIKDSYSVISMPLSKFGKCFNLPQEKDIIPYNLYTKENVKQRYIETNICRVACDIQVRQNLIHKVPSKKDYDDYYNKFIDNAKKWNCIIVKPDDEGQGVKGETPLVDIIEYSKKYCELDVEVLRLGYNKFGEMLKENCNLNVIDFMSSAQLAHNYMLKQGVFDGVLQLSSTPREYIMKCMVGGRTMCANNQKDRVTGRISDFDAVSLYPSAMKRLGGYLKGSPKVLSNKTKAFLDTCDGYFIQIKINKVDKLYEFPLMSYINEAGVRIFTNDPQETLYVSKIDLEDVIEFHNIEYEIIDGYYYDEGRNNKLEEVISFVFNERLKMKRQIRTDNEVFDFDTDKEAKAKEKELKEKNIKYTKGNPLQEIYKLIMNSSYGKCLQKAHPDKLVFKNQDNIDKFVDKNYNYINEYYEIYNEESDYKKYIVKMKQGIDEHFNNAHCGVEVLAMSKRIMNEVMCLAEQNKLKLYYQDTDSIHIKEEDIEVLQGLYNNKYNRELIGKGMGQFHSDFDSDIIKEDIHAVESIFLGKKCYIDKLCGKDENGDIVYDYHIRMKGVSDSAIKYKAKVEQKSFMEIYERLFRGVGETFDLCCGGEKAVFEFNSNYTISSKKSFPRTLRFD
jgi:hypothetical protein